MTIAELIQEYGLEQLGRFYGTYRGIVVSTKDEDKTNSIQVNVPSIYDGVTVWALPLNQHGGPNTGFKYLTPKNGQVVYVVFEYGDPLRAMWLYHGWAVGECPDDLDSDTIGLVTPSGNKVLLKEVDGTLYLKINKSVTIESSELFEIKSKLAKITTEDIDLIEGKVGIPESTPLVDKINALEKQLNKVMGAIRNGIPVTDQSGAGLQKSIVGLMGTDLPITVVDDIASPHIKQPQ